RRAGAGARGGRLRRGSSHPPARRGGAGKTSVVRRFFTQVASPARVLWGACDPLFTPRPLGPFLEMADRADGELARALESDARPHEVASALLRELRERQPTVVVLEDVQWADEETLDVVRPVGRRIADVRALVVATYRDDE